jgi:hypothetical protein
MSYPQTAVDMIQDVLHQAGEPPTNTSGPYYDKGWELINRCRLDIVRGNGPLDPDAHVAFKWAIKYPPGSFVIQPKITAGTVAVVQDSTSVTFSVDPTSDPVGWHLIIDGEPDIYRIVSSARGPYSPAVLDCAFTGTTNAAATFKLIKIEYDLGTNDIIRLISPLRIYRDHSAAKTQPTVDGLQEDRFDELFPLRDIVTGVPEAFKIVEEADNTVKIVISRYSDTDKMKVEYRCILLPADIDDASAEAEILIPAEYRFVCTDWAASMIMFDKGDNKHEATKKKAQLGFEAMCKDYKFQMTETDPNAFRVISREDKCQYSDRLLKTNSGLYFR